MDALILSCGTGGGHDSAAKAMVQELQIRGHRATMLNPYTLQSEALARRINNLYIAMARKTPRLFGAVYTAGQLYRQIPCRSPVYHINRNMARVMRQYLLEHPCDIVITTHLYPAEILTNMKNSGIDIPKSIFIATDYVCIPFTEETQCDAYVIPAKDLMPDYVGRGLPAEKLYPLGIPTSRVFVEAQSKAEARRSLGLEPNKEYILVAGGSMGGGTIRETIKLLMKGIAHRRDVALIIVCGSNKDLYTELNAGKLENTIVVGFTEDMACLMRACDLFITKPGGLSSTEAAVCGIPILHTAAIPGCERYNAEYFSAHGMSSLCHAPSEIVACTMAILSDPEIRAAMVEHQHAMLDGAAAARICRLVETLTSGNQE